jgi:hypothetical protein
MLLQGRREALQPAAALMAYQWLQQMPYLPGGLIPLPLGPWRRYQIGYDLPLALARAVGALLSVPVYRALSPHPDWHHLAEAGALRSRYRLRRALAGHTLAGHALTLITPQLSDASLRLAAASLQPRFPASCSALALLAES